jgi:hypothetical protein
LVVGLQAISNILLRTVVVAIAMLPVVAVTPGEALVNTNAKRCAPETGGVIVARGTLPEIKLRNVTGAITADDAIVTGANC